MPEEPDPEPVGGIKLNSKPTFDKDELKLLEDVDFKTTLMVKEIKRIFGGNLIK